MELGHGTTLLPRSSNSVSEAAPLAALGKVPASKIKQNHLIIEGKLIVTTIK